MMKSPSTPPRQQGDLLSLITPPPTLRSPKRLHFEDEGMGSRPKRLVTADEVDWSLLGDDEDDNTIRKDSDVSSIEGNNSKDQDLLSSDDEVLNSPVSDISASSIEEDVSKKGSGTTSVHSFDPSLLPESIEFMKLPRKIQHKIYALLLTIPAVVCVRQNRTPHEHFPLAFSNSADIKLLPGMAMALTQTSCDGFKSRFPRFAYVNPAILRTNSKIYSEAKKVLYGCNTFDFLNLTKETAPPADFRTPIFSPGCARMVRSVCIRANAVYSFRWMVTSGHIEIKNFYRSLEVLHLVLEIESIKKGYGKKLVRLPKENWVVYVKRVVAFIAVELFGCVGIAKKVPVWINLTAVFGGDPYNNNFDLNRDIIRNEADKITNTKIVAQDDEQFKKEDLKRAVSEAFELFKKGRR